MRLLLPPSETKRDGGDGAPLDLSALSGRELTPLRSVLVDRVVALAADPESMMRALKLGPRLAPEVERNRRLWDSPTMPAIDRYTGVLFDALEASTLSEASRGFAADTAVVHSALFGFVGALDPIPAYRLSHDSRLPGISLRRHWQSALSAQLASHRGLIVDLRSEGYADLGRAPVRDDSVFVRVVSIGADGRRRALNHFNKQAKGRFARAILTSQPDLRSVPDLIAWAAQEGLTLDPGDGPDSRPRELELLV
ncbi:MAG TPA: peroxide stress protein YaaA [Agromyces sp.]